MPGYDVHYYMIRISLISLMLILSLACSEAQNKLVGGPCEGCEAVFEYGDALLSAVDTLTGFDQSPAQIKLTGTVYKSDGRTPAEGVVLYFYHTNASGIYPKQGDESGWGKRHGYLRGWIKTDKKGRFTLYTSQPGSYPSRTNPAHIHLTILEPSGKYYWLEDYVFKGDPLLKKEDWNKPNPRGGHSGLMELNPGKGIQTLERDIILGKNIPNYN